MRARKDRRVLRVEAPPLVYVEIDPAEIPKGVKFDVPAHGRGEAIEIAWGGYGSDVIHQPGAPYKRIVDTVVPVGQPAEVTFYRLTEESIATLAAEDRRATEAPTVELPLCSACKGFPVIPGEACVDCGALAEVEA